MLPTVYDISTKEIATIDIKNSLNDAIKKMQQLNLRTIVVKNNKKYHILTTSTLIDFKLQGTKLDQTLEELNLPLVKTIEKDMNILTVLNQVNSTNDYMVILDDNGNLLGIISYTDIINNVDPKILMQKQSIGTLILNYKATFIYQNSSAIEAIRLIKENHIDSLIIKDSQENHIGIFTTKDFVDILHNDLTLDAPISKYMTSPLITLVEDATISEALDFIKEKHFKRIVIVDKKDKVLGIISQKSY